MANPQINLGADGTWLQVPADSTGKRILHLPVDVVQSDGSLQTVYIPASSIVDADGVPADVRPHEGHWELAITDRGAVRTLERLEMILMIQLAAMMQITLNDVDDLVRRADGDQSYQLQGV